MCIGIPRQLSTVLPDGMTGEWTDGDESDRVNLGLLEGVAVGDWVLVHSGIALHVVEPEEAHLVRDALRAAMLAGQGQAFDHLLADLVDREPELPPHLKPPARA